MPSEVGELVPDKLVVRAAKKSKINDTSSATLGDGIEEEIWELGLLPPELLDYFYVRQSTESHAFDLQGIELETDSVR